MLASSVDDEVASECCLDQQHLEILAANQLKSALHNVTASATWR